MAQLYVGSRVTAGDCGGEFGPFGEVSILRTEDLVHNMQGQAWVCLLFLGSHIGKAL